MTNFCSRGLRAALCIAATAAASACAPPDTDIVATNTEAVGEYDLAATRDGDALRANVCLAQPERADSVADNVLHQLMSRGYKSITLDMYAAPARPVRRVVWTPAARTDGPLTAAPPPDFCQTIAKRSADASEP